MSTIIKTNIGIIAYLIFIWVCIIFDWVNFGAGLGTLIYYYGIPIVIISLGLLQLFALWKAPKDGLNWLILLAGLFWTVVFTYYFTIGRGPEQTWDGQIFYF